MFTIGNDEIAKSQDLKDTITCYMCGKTHELKYGKVENKKTGQWEENPLLAFFHCGNSSYLAGINGKDVRKL